MIQTPNFVLFVSFVVKDVLGSGSADGESSTTPVLTAGAELAAGFFEKAVIDDLRDRKR